MSEAGIQPKWSLPYRTPHSSRGQRALRVAAYVLLVGAIVTPVVQFQIRTRRSHRKELEYRAFQDKYEHLTDEELAARGIKRLPAPGKTTRGAIGRWRWAVQPFWEGRNIYQPHEGTEPIPVWLHPNMPFTVILLTPFALLGVEAMALTFNLCKVLVLVAAILAAARLANHNGRKMPDWVLALALLWAILPIVGDIQHGNTNVFVLAAIVLHLWWYRRGHDLRAGAALALAICLKMTPALFLLYWAYQRNWKLLAAAVVALVLFAVVVPAAALGPSPYATLAGSWFDNLIYPGLVKGSWYPVHINQSLPGVFSRYFFAPPSPNGDIFWNPDDFTYAEQLQRQTPYWITLIGLPPWGVKLLVRVGQLAIVGLMAWAIGWRKLPRDDGRRALHYGLVALGMLLLNQRTWDHHAAILLPANVAIWYAIAFGRVGRRVRWAALILMLLAGLLVWGGGTTYFALIAKMMGESAKVGDRWADIAEAYGPAFYHFVLLLATAAMLSIALRHGTDPYADRRQRLSG